MTRRLFLLVAVILYVASPVAQAFATSHVRPPAAELVQGSANTEGTSGTFGKFLSENHEAFRTYGLIVGATIGLIFAFWRAKIATRQAEAAAERADAAIDQARAANAQADTAEQGHITERFSRAIEQLGHNRPAVRIGGLYALKRIAEDSVERDHLTIMDVLTSFIRQPPYANRQREAAERGRELRSHKIIARSGSAGGTAEPPPEPELIDCPDIVAAIEIINGRSEDQKEVEDKRKYRLSLSRASLSYLRLPEVDLHIFDLAGANFTGTELTRAKLLDANLVGAKLLDANLVDANLLEADLSGADLSGADLTGAELTDANLRRANLSDSDLVDAKLTRAKLMSANLPRTDLTGADLMDTDLRRADLMDAQLMDADLTGANLTGAELTQDQLDSACISKDGKPPDLLEGLKPPQNVCGPRTR